MPAYKNEYEIEQAIPVTFSDSQTLHCPFYPFEGDTDFNSSGNEDVCSKKCGINSLKV